MKPLVFVLAILLSNITWAAPTYDYSTPETALKSLENAYINKDIEAAVKSKAFSKEALNMLLSLGNKDIIDDDLVKQTTEVLELSFRKQIHDKGFPNFKGISCSATSKNTGNDSAIITEICRYPDNGISKQKLNAYRINNKWKIGEVVQE